MGGFVCDSIPLMRGSEKPIIKVWGRWERINMELFQIYLSTVCVKYYQIVGASLV